MRSWGRRGERRSSGGGCGSSGFYLFSLSKIKCYFFSWRDSLWRFTINYYTVSLVCLIISINIQKAFKIILSCG